MKSGVLNLLPSPLGDNLPLEVIPQYAFDQIKNVTHFVVEELRTARRYLSKIGFKGQIDTLSFYELNEHTDIITIEQYITILDNGNDVVLISEAGLPAVADPGAQLVRLAHIHNVEVCPFVGPSSLMLALMSSGLNGQCFSFSGYIPVKQNERKEFLKQIEKRSHLKNETQIFIETPYRNDSLMNDILSTCLPSTSLCIAADITLPSQFIKTMKVSEWVKSPIQIGKRPCVFLILSK
jgi:16S rRNA (cytidine1402-2'-O)-methyltransferase